MSGPATIGTGLARTDSGGPGAPDSRAVVLQERENAAMEHLAKRSGFDIATIDERQFEERLKLIKVRQERMRKVIAQVLTEGLHYGNPILYERDGATPKVDADGKPKRAFDQPILLNPGASELRNFFKISVREVEPTQRVVTKEFCSCHVVVGAFDSIGNLLGTAIASCNSKEPRFRFNDAREQLNNIEKQAFKRAANQITAQVTGADAFFYTEDKLEATTAAGRQPWSKEEREEIVALAKQKGVTSKELWGELLEATLGRDKVYAGDDVKELRAAIARLPVPKSGEPVKVGSSLKAAREQAAARASDLDDLQHPPKVLEDDGDLFPDE